MRALIYLFLTGIKNALLQLLKKPVLVLVYAFFILVLVLSLIPGGKTPVFSADMTPVLRAISFAVFGFVAYSSISKGLKQGSTFFSMPDVNMLFTSPIKPQAVLLYGVVKQMGMSAMATVFMFFQISNMKNLLHLNGTGIFAVISAWFIILVCAQVVSLCTYSLTAPYPNRRRAGNYVLYGLIAALVLGLVAYLLSRGGEMNAVLEYFGLPFIDYVPLVGWINAYMMGMISGEIGKALLFLLLTLFFPTLGIVLLQRTNSDYYEDVLSATEQTYMLRQAVKDGRIGTKNVSRNVRAGRSGIGRGQGASVFFYRHLTEQRRTGMILLDKGSAVIIVIAAVGGIIFRNLTEKGDITPFFSSLAAFCVLAYVLYFLSITGKFTQELSRPFIYLAPAPEIQKLFYSNLTAVLKSLVEGLIAFSILTALAGLPLWYAPMAALTYASLSQVYVSMSILTSRILGGSSSKVLNTILYLVCAGVLLVPGAVMFGILQAVFYFNGQYLVFVAYLAAIGYNVTVSALSLFLGRGILRDVEMRI